MLTALPVSRGCLTRGRPSTAPARFESQPDPDCMAARSRRRGRATSVAGAVPAVLKRHHWGFATEEDTNSYTTCGDTVRHDVHIALKLPTGQYGYLGIHFGGFLMDCRSLMMAVWSGGLQAWSGRGRSRRCYWHEV